MISETVFKLTQGNETITSVVAANPERDPHTVAAELFKATAKESSTGFVRAVKTAIGLKDQTRVAAHIDPTPEDLDRAAQCGRFPTRPSDLFLKIYHNVLQTLDEDPMAGVVSPPLMASSGVVPVAIVSVIKDIMNHYASLIVEAQEEVFLATNYWQSSHASKIITDALLELSKRAQSRNKKVVVKIMYDRGSVKQFVNNRLKVPESEWLQDAVQLPKLEDVPGLFLEVVNYHKPALGTFHCKYMVIDRRIAVLNSNNIQDMANLEMMTQIEGPIVDSFFDMALWSWGLKLEPPLPCLQNARTEPKGKDGYAWPRTVSWDTGKGKVNTAAASELRPNEQVEGQQQQQQQQQPMGQSGGPQPTPTSTNQAAPSQTTTAPTPAASEVPRAVSNNATPAGTTTEQIPQPYGEQAQQTPAQPQPQAAATQNQNQTTNTDAGINPSGSTNTGAINTGTSVAVSNRPTPEEKDKGKDKKDKKDKKDDKPPQPLPEGSLDPIGKNLFDPAMFLQPHDEVPMAMVCRKPYGNPGHGDTFCPQDVAWLTAMEYAQHDVFIQTPDLNTKPIIEAVVACVKRGIEVTLYITVGYNDAGEALPYQGGTNEEVIKNMFADLHDDVKENLHVHWYTAKDWNVPINASHKLRNCHVKVMLVDDHIAIQGNGNQDTQSWFHSMEINVMLDSNLIVRSWRELIERAQNTAIAGRVGEDGMWRDGQGNEMPDSTGIHSGPKGLVMGVKGSIERVRGTGGF